MASACVYKDKSRTVIHELTQGIQMAKQLSVNLHSPEAREFFIQKILSSYENVISALKSPDSAGQPQASARPASRLPEPSIFTTNPGSEKFSFDQPFTIHHEQNVINKKRKVSTTWDNQVNICTGNGLDVNTDDGYNWRMYGPKDISDTKFPRNHKIQKCSATKQVPNLDEDFTAFEVTYKGQHTCDHGAQSAVPLPPPSPVKHEITPTHHHHHDQLSPPPNPDEMLSNLKANLSVNTFDLGGDTIPSPLSLPSIYFGLMEDYQLHFLNQYDDELLPIYQPPFIIPECGSLPPSDFPAIWQLSNF